MKRQNFRLFPFVVILAAIAALPNTVCAAENGGVFEQVEIGPVMPGGRATDYDPYNASDKLNFHF